MQQREGFAVSVEVIFDGLLCGSAGESSCGEGAADWSCTEQRQVGLVGTTSRRLCRARWRVFSDGGTCGYHRFNSASVTG